MSFTPRDAAKGVLHDISPSILYLHLYGWICARCCGNSNAQVCSELEEEEEESQYALAALLLVIPLALFYFFWIFETVNEMHSICYLTATMPRIC